VPSSRNAPHSSAGGERDDPAARQPGGSVSLEIEEGGIATIVLDRPPLNVYDLQMRDLLIEAVATLHDLPGLRVTVLRAEGPHFSAGADLGEFGSAAFPLEARRVRWDRDPWTPLWDLAVPVIAALHGYTLGAGLEMTLYCDVRLATPDTVVGLPEPGLGMLPAAGGSQTLTRLLGPAAALPVLQLGQRMSAEEARTRGIVDEIVADSDRSARDLAERLAACDPRAVRTLKRQLREAADGPGGPPRRLGRRLL
jgi:enoyl-CoA hydratase/carnithine racemase